MGEVCIVTSNEERFLFAKKSLSNYNICLLKKSFKLNEIQAGTAKEIAIDKVVRAAKNIGQPCICEDTEFIINSLNGFPGPYMKFAQKTLDIDKIISMISNEKDKSAVFRSILVYADQNDLIKSFETVLFGEIITLPVGEFGRGWDTIFKITNSGKTLAQYNTDERFSLWNKGYLEFGKWFVGRNNV